MSIFEKAAREKLRFSTVNGLISVEDLWDLPLEGKRLNLDSIAIELNKQLQDDSNQSFVAKKTAGNEATVLRFEIVKHIISVKLKERELQQERIAKEEQRRKVTAALAARQDAALNNMSEEELKAMLRTLEE